MSAVHAQAAAAQGGGAAAAGLGTGSAASCRWGARTSTYEQSLPHLVGSSRKRACIGQKRGRVGQESTTCCQRNRYKRAQAAAVCCLGTAPLPPHSMQLRLLAQPQHITAQHIPAQRSGHTCGCLTSSMPTDTRRRCPPLIPFMLISSSPIRVCCGVEVGRGEVGVLLHGLKSKVTNDAYGELAPPTPLPQAHGRPCSDAPANCNQLQVAPALLAALEPRAKPILGSGSSWPRRAARFQMAGHHNMLSHIVPHLAAFQLQVSQDRIHPSALLRRRHAARQLEQGGGGDGLAHRGGRHQHVPLLHV